MAGSDRGAELLREAGLPPGPSGQCERSQGLLLGGPETHDEAAAATPVSTGGRRPSPESRCPHAGPWASRLFHRLMCSVWTGWESTFHGKEVGCAELTKARHFYFL